MKAPTINRKFLEYAKASKDLNPVINDSPYALPVKQGEFFFHYKDMQEDEAYREKNFYWMHNFKILLTNGLPSMPPELLDEMAANGSSNFFYNALGGFYEYEAFKHRLGEQKLDFGDPPCTILTNEKGERMPAEMRDGTWRFDIVENHQSWLINPDNPIGGRSSGDFGGYYGGKAYFFDFAADPASLADYMAKVLEDFSAESHYNGAFFDYCSAGWKGSFLPKRVINLYAEKYGYLNEDKSVDFQRAVEAYDRDAGWFLYLLRQRLSRRIDIFANQCFYSYKNYYPAVDHDITESYFVSFAYGRQGKEIYAETPDNPGKPQKLFTTQTFYRGLKGSITDSSAESRANTAEDTISMKDNENTISQITSRALKAIQTARTFNGCPRFYFLDYMTPRYVKTGRTYEGQDVYRAVTDRQAIFYALACYRLFNCEGSVSDWYGGAGNYDKDDLYFVDLGKTLNTAYGTYLADGTAVDDENTADYAIRYFENGFSLISGDVVKESIRYVLDGKFIPENVQGLYDMYERTYSEDKLSVTVHPNYYEMLDSYVNPNNPEDVDDGYRPVGRVFMYIYRDIHDSQ